jgi:hypothetical protein
MSDDEIDQEISDHLDIWLRYSNDLKAMHDAEKTLYKGFIDEDYWQKGYGRYQTLLGELSATPYSATSRERAEAFLRTIGKWKD